MERATGQLVFLQLFHTGQADFFQKVFFSISYNKFCTVPYEEL